MKCIPHFTHLSTIIALGISLLLPMLALGQGAGGAVVHNGIPHTPVGSAELEADGKNVFISILGPEGNDGVRLHLGHSLCFETGLEIPKDAGRWSVRTQAESTIDGEGGIPTAGIDLKHDPGANQGNTVLRPNFGNVPEDGMIRYDVLLGNGKLHSFILPYRDLLPATWHVDSFFDIAYRIESSAYSPKQDCERNRPFCMAGVMFPQELGSVPITIAGRTVHGVGVQMSYVGNHFEAGTQSQNIIAILIGLSQPTDVTLFGQEFKNGANLDGVPVLSLGQAETTLGEDGRLLVSDVGPSGEDGVCFDFGEIHGGFQLGFGAESGHFQPDTFFDISAEVSPDPRGLLLPAVQKVRLQANPNAQGVLLDADFGEQSQLATVEVWNKGELVKECAELSTGDALGVIMGPFQGLPRLGGFGKLGGLPPGQLPCFILPFPDGMQFQPEEGDAATGDEVRVLITDSSPIQSIKQAKIRRGAAAGGGPHVSDPIELVSLQLTSAVPVITKIEALPRIPDDNGGNSGRPRFKLLGHGFPEDPRDLLVLYTLTTDQNLHLPMPVIGIPSSECAIVELPPLPPGTRPGGVPCIILAGEGQRLPLPPERGGFARWADSFFGMDNGNRNQIPLPDPDPDDDRIPPRTAWFFGPVEENALCLPLTGDWLPNTIIDIQAHISAHFQGHPEPLHFSLSVHDLILPGGGATEECAERLGKLLQMLFAQHFGLPRDFLKVETVVNGEEVKLLIHVIDPATEQPADLAESGLAICIRSPKPNPPVIHDVTLSTPGIITRDTIIKITGENLGNAGSDVIVQMCTTPRPTILQPVLVTENCVIAKVGPLWPDSEPGPIKLYCGRGQIQPWIPQFINLEPETPAEFVFAPPFRPVEFDPFQGQTPPVLFPPEERPEDVQYIDAEVVDGRLCLRLESDWGRDVAVSLLGIIVSPNPDFDPDPPPGTTLFHSETIAGFFRADRTRIRGTGTRLACAERIKDILRCAFEMLEAECEVDPETGDVIIYTWLPGFPFLEESTFQLCVFRPAVRPVLELSHNLTPGPIGPGSLIELIGRNLPADPHGVCAAFGQVPLQIVANPKGNLIGRVGLMPPGTELGPLRVEAGRGQRGVIFPRFPILRGPRLPGVPMQVFVGDGVGPAPETLPPLRQRPPSQDPQATYFHSQPGDDGELCLILEGDWCPDAVISFQGHLAKTRGENRPPLTFDFFIGDLRVPGGPVEQCARFLKDLPACGFEQLACARRMLIWECIPLGDPDGNGQDAVKIIVRCALGNPLHGRMTLCVRCPLPDLEIKRVTTVDGRPPVCLRECELICIEACYAGTRPKDLCAQIGNRPGNITPLTVQEIIPGVDGAPDKIIAQVGKVPPNAYPAPVYITRGQGNCGIWQPGVAALERPTRPGWVFDSLGNPTAQSERLVGRKSNTDPPPTERCFVGLPNQDNSAICLDLVGAWAPGSIIKVTGHIRVFNEQGAIGRDISSPITSTINGGSAEDCAVALKDIFRCQFDQLAELSEVFFECPPDNDNDPNTATFKIRPAVPGVGISGRITVCVCAPPQQPVVEEIVANPNGVCPGDIVCIIGSGFSPRPDDYCVVVGTGADAFSLAVLEVVPLPNGRFKLICQVGVIPPQLDAGNPLPLCIGIAHGKRVPFSEVVPGMAADASPWVWSNPGNFPVLCIPDAIVPAPKPPPPGQRWFHAVHGQNGELCITIPAGIVWQPQQLVDINGHIVLPPPYGHIDIRSTRVRLRGGGTPEDCAAAITDILRCVFQQLEGFNLVDISWTVTQGTIKITLRWPDTNPDTGNPFPLNGFLDICLTDPPQRPQNIDNDPVQVRPGDLITVRGTGFGDNPDDLCMVIRLPNGQRIPVRVEDINQGEIIGRVGPIPPNARGPGCIEVMRGRGVAAPPGQIQFAFDQIQPEQPVWVWEGINPDAKAKGPENVDPIPEAPPNGQRWFFARLVDGKLCLIIEGDWEENSEVRITARAHNECQRLDLDAPQTIFLGQGSAMECARLLKDFLTCAFRQQTGAIVNITCDPIAGTNAVKITIELENGKPIDWGLCTVCVSPVPSTSGDRDNDGIPDHLEAQFGTDPDNPDTDGDGLLDGAEVHVHGTNPLRADTDGDGSPDGAEIAIGTDPTDANDSIEIEFIEIDPATGEIQACIPRTLLGRAYSIRCSTDLGDFIIVEDGRDLLPRFNPDTGETEPIDITIGGITGDRKFFDVRVRIP